MRGIRPGVNKIEDVYHRELIVGATGVGSGTTVYPIIMNNLLGHQVQDHRRLQASRDVDLAMARGEVGGRAGNNFQSVKSAHPDWIRDKNLVFITQIGLKRDPEFADVPLLTELAGNDEQRAIFKMFSVPVAIGRPFLTTPGVPTERAVALRKAFEDTMKDPQFLAEGRKSGLDISPESGAELTEVVRELTDTPPDIVSKAKQASR